MRVIHRTLEPARRRATLHAVAVRNRTKTIGVSLLLHVVAIALLAVLGSGRILDRSDEPIEFEIIAPVPYDEPEPEPDEPPPDPEPPPVPEVQRPEVIPREVKQVVREDPRPFQENAVTTEQPREIPDDIEAVPTPTTPVIEMESYVGATTETDYVTTSSDVGSVPVREGPGGGRGGAPGSGAPGNQANQDAVDIEVSRDWEITQLPEPLNDRDFDPVYPATAKREKREAVVIVELVVDVGGSVAKASVIDGPGGGHGFERAAVAYAKRLRFEPALAGERPVASRIDWSVHFYVRN
jgi:TonB family protein